MLLAAATVLVGAVGLQKSSPVDALIFALRSMLLLPNSTHVVTTTAGDGLQVALRVLGPVLIALVALGVRSQVKR